MSKKCIAAIEQQGCSTPIRLANDAILVKQIRSLIENEILIPLSESHRRTDELSELFRTVQDIATDVMAARGDHTAYLHAMAKIKGLASIGRSAATDIADFAGDADESVRDTHMHTILAAVAEGEQL